MAVANSSDVRTHVDHPVRSAHMSVADVAAHRAASYVRGDSDPHADELLPRVRHPRGNWTICPECSGNLTPGHVCPPKSALYRLEVEAAYLERDRQIDAPAAREIAGAVA